jgi:hypothetical protein
MLYRLLPSLGAGLLLAFLALTCPADCSWFWQLETSDTCPEYQEASLLCQAEYTSSAPLCYGCLTEKHREALGIKRGSPLPTSTAGEAVMDCFDQRVRRCQEKQLGRVFALCVERVTGLPTIKED